VRLGVVAPGGRRGRRHRRGRRGGLRLRRRIGDGFGAIRRLGHTPALTRRRFRRGDGALHCHQNPTTTGPLGRV
jgi:hypothetical protein